MQRLVTIALWLVSLSLFAQTPVPDPATVDHTTGDFHNCPAIGDAHLDVGQPNPGGADPFLNALKNRNEAPAENTYTAKTVGALIADVPAAKAAGPKRRDKWTAAQRNSVKSKETQAIEVIGFFAGVKHEGKESCNCHDADRNDFHTWLVAGAGQKRSKSIVAEISPRMLDDHPNWPALATKAWHDGTLVRVRGWRMWDQEHGDQIGNTRGTLWEIHPIHEIDIEDDNGEWVPIDGNGGN